MKIRIEPYKTWSGGARRLGRRAGILRATPKQIKRHGDFDLIINWGRSERRFHGNYLNEPEKVRTASDKRCAVELFKGAGVNTPDYTFDRDMAQSWVDDGGTVLARTLTRASGGRGIFICSPEEHSRIPKAPLYTRYVKKTDEYRVHVWQGKVIDVQCKKRSRDVPDDKVNWQIRNHDNGFIYARGGCNPPDGIDTISCAAVSSLALDFGAVDLGYNERAKEYTVYEVNTAPGLEGSTVNAYYQALRSTYPAITGGMYAKRRGRSV